MIQNVNLTFKTSTPLVKGRFVDVNPITDEVVYSTAGDTADGITIGDSKNGVVSVELLRAKNDSFFIESADVITIGDSIEVGTDGTAVALTSGTKVAVAKTSAVSGSFVTGYNY